MLDGIDPWDRRFRPRFVEIVEVWIDLWSEMRHYPPQVERDLDVGPKATIAARWLHEPQPSSNQSVASGFPHRSGRCRSRENPFSSRVCRSCRCVEGFLLQGWYLILPGVRWLYARVPANERAASGAGVSTACGAFRPGGSIFRPQVVGVVKD